MNTIIKNIEDAQLIPTYHKVVIFRHKLAPLIFCFVSNTFERC